MKQITFWNGLFYKFNKKTNKKLQVHKLKEKSMMSQVSCDVFCPTLSAPPKCWSRETHEVNDVTELWLTRAVVDFLSVLFKGCVIYIWETICEEWQAKVIKESSNFNKVRGLNQSEWEAWGLWNNVKQIKMGGVATKFLPQANFYDKNLSICKHQFHSYLSVTAPVCMWCTCQLFH